MRVTRAERTKAGGILAEIDGLETSVSEDPSTPGRQAVAEWEAAGNTITPYAPPPPSGQDVNVERANRIVEGNSFTVTGHAAPIQVTGTDEDMRNLQGLAVAAQARMGRGDTTHVTTYRDGNNEMHDLSPAQVFELWSKGAAYIEAIYAASWAIKAMTPIPSPVSDDALWPVRT